MKKWALQEAKARFSELVNVCIEEGPQVVTRHGRDSVVVMSMEEYTRRASGEGSLKDFFLLLP